MIREQLEKIAQGIDLSRQEAALVLQMMIENQLSGTEIGAFLFGLRMKGESVNEIQGFIDTMQQNMVRVHLSDREAVDVCGTGSDNKHSFNVSTATAIVTAAGGVTVAKHGNRSVSSKTGSADVLEELGVRIDLPPEKTRQCIDETGIGFLFAPLYHPAMKAVVPHRRNLATRTVFNMLGPLLNPAGVRRQLIGTFNLETAEKMASVLLQRRYAKACVVHSEDGFDEISPFAENRIFEVDSRYKTVHQNRFHSGLKADPSVRGGDRTANARILLAILQGDRGTHREMTLLNAAFGLYVAGKVDDPGEGRQLAAELIDSGKALAKLNDFISVSQKLAT